uniref:Reverse transcriptase domain-containing protein n=1 Tax=Heligmosomoides polygyrus TaxID=6339 RepID=A0A183GWI8_HELPZ
LYYNGEDTKRNGVGIAVAESLKDSVAAVQRINDRIMSLRLDTKEGYWTIMFVYAPQTGCSEHDKDDFYLSLEEAIVPEGDYLSIAGDMNGHVGSGRRGVERVHGGRGIGLINSDGERILDLAIAHDLAVCSTFFAKRESEKVTYASAGGRTEVDHILVRRAALKAVREVDVIWGRQRNELRRAVLEAGLPDPAGPVNETWRRVAQTILRCAKETLGETRGGTRGDKSAWFWDEEVQAAVKRKKEAYKLWQKTRAPEHLTAYRKLKRLAKTAVAKAKNAEMDALYEKLDGPEGEKFAIRLAKARHRASLDIRIVKTVKSADGRVLRKPVEVRERWEEYFKELLNEEFPRREAEEEQPTEGPIPPWTQEEVRKAIGKMKLGKAAGPDGVPVEAWKVLGDLGVNWLTQFLNRITKKGKMPDDWRKSTIVPIFKQKGDASECSSFRGIKLISHTMKIYERLVDSRLREMVHISQLQRGFMPERSTTDAIFIARQVMEKYREKRKPCYLAFLGLEKACDRLARAVIWNALNLE